MSIMSLVIFETHEGEGSHLKTPMKPYTIVQY